MDQEVKIDDTVKENEGQVFYDLEDELDREKLEKELNSGSNFFKPEVDTTYKVVLTSPRLKEVVKVFDGEEVIKYAIQVKAVKKDGTEFEGFWEVGRSVIEPIFKNYSKDQVFKITKTGSGKDTRYSVVADF